MSISEISGTAMMAGGGIDAIEGRIKQLESMIGAMRTRQAAPLNSSTNLPVDPLASSETAPTAKPFQFYLRQVSQTVTSPTTTVYQNPALSKTECFQQFQPLIVKLSEQYSLDKNLVNSVIQQESGFNPEAVSSAGATGLMQLMPSTAKHLGVSNPKDPSQNLEGGVRYLKGLMEQFNGNIPLALAAYNAGPGAVNRYKGIPPYPETQHYVRNILSTYLKAKHESMS